MSEENKKIVYNMTLPLIMALEQDAREWLKQEILKALDAKDAALAEREATILHLQNDKEQFLSKEENNPVLLRSKIETLEAKVQSMQAVVEAAKKLPEMECKSVGNFKVPHCEICGFYAALKIYNPGGPSEAEG